MNDDTNNQEVPEELPGPPSLKRKVISGASWGMIAGFWAELPILITSAFKEINIGKWSARLVLPATLVGLIYGLTKSQKQSPSQPKETSPTPISLLQAQSDRADGVKSWAAAEQSKSAEPAAMARQ